MPRVEAFWLDFPAKASALADNPIYRIWRVMTELAQHTETIPAKIEASAHSFDSSLREQALVHIFLGQLLTFMWLNGGRDIEVLKSEVDRGGYDLVLEAWISPHREQRFQSIVSSDFRRS